MNLKSIIQNDNKSKKENNQLTKQVEFLYYLNNRIKENNTNQEKELYQDLYQEFKINDINENTVNNIFNKYNKNLDKNIQNILYKEKELFMFSLYFSNNNLFQFIKNMKKYAFKDSIIAFIIILSSIMLTTSFLSGNIFFGFITGLFMSLSIIAFTLVFTYFNNKNIKGYTNIKVNSYTIEINKINDRNNILIKIDLIKNYNIIGSEVHLITTSKIIESKKFNIDNEEEILNYKVSLENKIKKLEEQEINKINELKNVVLNNKEIKLLNKIKEDEFIYNLNNKSKRADNLIAILKK